MRSTPLLRNQRFHAWAMAHPVRGSIVVGLVFGATASLITGLFVGVASLSAGDGFGLVSVISPLWLVVGVVIFGPVAVTLSRWQERRSV